jgi:hypothetical protein
MMFGWFFKKPKTIDDFVEEAVTDCLKSDEFGSMLEKVVIEIIEEGRDDGLSSVGFGLKIAVELYRKAGNISWSEAKRMSVDIYRQFKKDSGIKKFGEPGWDWSGAGARTLAYEYEISYWDEK